ncbi:MAG: hypothetical protein REI94_02995 [Moraxellaceae bacterium]|nr:hypothetical protein [Moraxellaceae bacterium]
MSLPDPADAELLARLRKEELLRQEVRASLAPPAPPKSRFDKLLALLNTNVGIGTVAALLVSVGTWAFTTLDDHFNKAARDAERARLQALADVQNVSPFLPLLAIPDSPERGLACRVLFHMIASGAINETLGQGLAQETGSCAAKGGVDARSVAELDRRTDIAQVALVGPDAAATSVTSTAPPPSAAQQALAQALPRRIYIQYASEAQRQVVSQLRSIYSARGWIVPAAENIGGKAPPQLQVRYFSQADEAAAAETWRLLSETAPFNTMPMANGPRLLKLPAPPGQIEVWLPAD